MAIDWTVRCLTRLQTASSSRVLNLAAIATAQADNGGHATTPFFKSPILNRSIVLKHRLRGDEADAFQGQRAVATKIIVPFEKTDLRAGGQSFFVGERGYENMLLEIGNYPDRAAMERDHNLLRLLDSVPSLDPFLLREHLRNHEFEPDPCYFQISAADQERMYHHASQEIGRLTAIALGELSGKKISSASRMVAALLSSEVNEKLEPLRVTLNLNHSEFSEGVFSWRGFLYYKWSLSEFWPALIQVLRDIRTIKPATRLGPEQAVYMENTKLAIIRGIKFESAEVRNILGVYDAAYGRLLESKNPQMFREFLLSAPAFFVEMGEKIGAMSHVASFWRYRFPMGAIRSADADELTAIFQDFARSFDVEVKLAA